MTKKWMGMIAGVALATGGFAFAQDTTSTTTPETQSQPADTPDSMGSQPSDQLGNDSAAAGADQQQGVGGSGSQGTSSDTAAQTGTGGAGQSSTQPATPATPASPSSKSHKDDPAAASAGGEAQAEQQLTATVEKVQGKTVFVDHMGAVVALTTNKSTQFEGVKRAKELQEGQQIRASFTVKNGTQNLAKSITVDQAGTGGAGTETQGGLETGTPPADTGTPPPADTGSAPQPGTGGSGVEGSAGSTSGSEAGTGGSGMEEPSSTSTQPESEMDHRGLETEGQGGAGEAGGEGGSATDTRTGGDKY